MAVTRLITMDDAVTLARLVTADRDYLAPWFRSMTTGTTPRTVSARCLRATLWRMNGAGSSRWRYRHRRRALRAHQPEHHQPRVIPGGSVGYWVSESRAGHGLASAAVAEVDGIGFGELGLHRLEAATLLHNTPSQRLLTRNGYRPFAISEAYLKIARGLPQDRQKMAGSRPVSTAQPGLGRPRG